MDPINNYMNKDQHVDTSINANAFLSSEIGRAHV